MATRKKAAAAPAAVEFQSLDELLAAKVKTWSLVNPVDLEQGSQEWLNWRLTRYTASNAGAVLGCNPWFPATPLQLYQLRTGQRSVVVTQRMKDGNTAEPRMRELLGQKGIIGRPAVYERSLGPLAMGASLDLFVLRGDGAAVGYELKRPEAGSGSPLWKANQAPDHYRAQMVHQIITAGLDECSLVVYAHDLDQLRVVETIESDSPEFLCMAAQLLDAWLAFDLAESSMTAPAPTDKDVVMVPETDQSFARLVDTYRQAQQAADIAQADLENARDALLAAAKTLGGGSKVQGHGALIYSTSRAGTVNWKAQAIVDALAAAGVNPENYRGKGSTSWTVKIDDKGQE